MSLIQWPFTRKTYAGIKNPVFVDDIKAVNQGLNDAIVVVTGMGTTDFAILSGLELVLGTPNTYTKGWYYFNGQIYYIDTSFNELLYLQVNPTDTLLEGFIDPVTTKYIYTINYATATSTALGNTPQFSGDMNQYRISNKYLQQEVLTILGITDDLGTTAFTNLGTGAGQVLTADQTYTQAQVNSLLLTRAPSCIGCVVEVHDFNGTFPDNFNGSGLGIVYPWYNSATGERWGLAEGVASSGGNTAPNLAGKTTIGQGTDSGSHTFTEGTTYGANSYQIEADDLPQLFTSAKFLNSGGASVSAYAPTPNTGSLAREGVNDGSPNNPISLMQSSYAIYKVIRLS